MTHDGAFSWMSRALGYTDKRTDKIGRIVVKDNCFIGAKTIIMQNVTIENNYIVGTGAIVEYSCGSKSRIRKFGNRSSGTRKSSFLCLITVPFL